MPSSTEPRSGLKSGWSLGENNWNTEMDENLLSIGRFAFHLSVKDRNLSTPPVSPVAGDSYIVGPTATGAWVGKENQVTVWSGTAWVFGVPRLGWVAWIEDEAVISAYTTAWSTGLALTETASAAQAAVTLGNTDGEIAALTFSTTPTQAEAIALRDKAEELADDVRNLSVLLHQLRLDLVALGAIKGSA